MSEDIYGEPRPVSATPMSREWVRGYDTAYERREHWPDGVDVFLNPFKQGTDAWAGFEEAVFDLTQE